MKRKSKELKRKSEETKRKQKEIKENEKKTERKIKEKADEVAAAAAVTAAAAAAVAHPFVRSPVRPCPFARSSIHRPRNLNKFLGLWPIRSSVGLSAHSPFRSPACSNGGNY